MKTNTIHKLNNIAYTKLKNESDKFLKHWVGYVCSTYTFEVSRFSTGELIDIAKTINSNTWRPEFKTILKIINGRSIEDEYKLELLLLQDCK